MSSKIISKTSPIVKLLTIAMLFYTPTLLAQLFFKGALEGKTFTIVYFSATTIIVNIIIIVFAAKRRYLENHKFIAEIIQLPTSFLPIIFLATLGLFFIIDPLEEVFSVSTIRVNYVGALMQSKVYSFLIIVVVVPVLQEVVFRAIILKRLLSKYNPIVAIALSALLFGATYFSMAQLFSGFIGGTLLGYIFWQTKSLSTCIVMHSVYNALSFFSYHLLKTDFSIESAIDNTPIYLSLYLLSAIALAVSILFIYKKSYANQAG